MHFHLTLTRDAHQNQDILAAVLFFPHPAADRVAKTLMHVLDGGEYAHETTDIVLYIVWD